MPKINFGNLTNQGKDHALFSPSGMVRWRKEHCPGSIKLSQRVPELPPHPAAAEGTRGHIHLELILADLYLGRPFLTRTLPNIKSDTRRAVDKALQIIAQLVMRGCRVIGVELRVHASEDVWGTLDVLLYDESNNLLMVLDYKNGIQPVCAEDNPQLMCYGWGAFQRYKEQFPQVDRICLGIIQPNSSDHKIFSTDIKYVCQLFDFYLYMNECVEVAKAPNPPIKAGDWCFWCKAIHSCSVRATARQKAKLNDKLLANISQIYRNHEQSNSDKL